MTCSGRTVTVSNTTVRVGSTSVIDVKKDGKDGRQIELQATATYIQWRYVGATEWIDLVLLEALKGADGYTPVKGVDYFDGINGINGSVWRSGSGAPSNALGVDTDFYLDIVTDDVYQKVANSYTIVANIKGNSGADGVVLQVVNYFTNLVSSFTALIPLDDTVPQVTEGYEVFSVSITPKQSNSLFLCELDITLSRSSNSTHTFAVFLNQQPDAIFATSETLGGSATLVRFHTCFPFTIPNTNVNTISVRGGGTVAFVTITVNGIGGTRRFGGSSMSGLSITEIAQ